MATGPPLRGLGTSTGKVGGADLGERQTNEAPLTAEKAIADLGHYRLGHALIGRTVADEFVDLGSGRLVDVRDARNGNPAFIIADQARDLRRRPQMLNLGALGIRGEGKSTGDWVIGDRTHGIADRASGAVAAKEKHAVVGVDELDDVWRVE
jgi:hypothetical protein